MKKGSNNKYSPFSNSTFVETGFLNTRFINVVQMRKEFIGYILNDRRTMKNINVYYETMSPENCKKMKLSKDCLNLNCLDGDGLFNKEKQIREALGYSYKEPVDVVIDGIEVKRIIITGIKGKNYNEHLGLISGYVQAEHEIVCYKVSY